MSDFLLGLQEIPFTIWICLVVFIVIIVTQLLLKTKFKKQYDSKSTTKLLVFGGMSIALSFILSYIKLFEMPQGGSITLVSMLPIMLFTFVCGTRVGIVCGLAYGFLQFFQGAYAAHWLSILLDYPLAFACLGLVGIIPKTIKSLNLRFSLGVIFAMLGRFLMHLLSGVLFFAEYTPEGINPWIYSSVYNASYLSIECIITLIIGCIILTTPIYKYLKISFASVYTYKSKL